MPTAFKIYFMPMALNPDGVFEKYCLVLAVGGVPTRPIKYVNCLIFFYLMTLPDRVFGVYGLVLPWLVSTPASACCKNKKGQDFLLTFLETMQFLMSYV
jgi:hypothetical protein